MCLFTMNRRKKMKIPITVNIGKEFKEQVDQLVSDMKAYGRKQVWEECTCKNCKWWQQQAEYSNKEWDCFNDIIEAIPFLI